MKQYFKIGEISKLYQIGPDSLRYYEELGILNPKRGHNDYRLYSIHDLWQLNVIRDLRKLDFPMDKIKTYLEHRSVASTEALLCDELDAILEKQKMLSSFQQEVESRLQILKEAQLRIPGKIETKNFSPRSCHMIHSGYQKDEEMDVLIKQLLNKNQDTLYIIGNNRIGSVLSLDAVAQGHFREYKSVFIMDEKGSDILAGGTYLTVSYLGDCEQNSIYLPLLIEEAKKQNLTLSGPALELLWIDIHQAEDPSEHMTELQIRCTL